MNKLMTLVLEVSPGNKKWYFEFFSQKVTIPQVFLLVAAQVRLLKRYITKRQIGFFSLGQITNEIQK